MTLSVIVPTRNRAALWRSGWLLDGLRAQTEPPDELLIALDHTDDDTLDAITAAPIGVRTRIIEVLTPRTGPNPASAHADNCLFAAAAGDILVHLDDDLAVKPDLCRRLRTLLDSEARAVIWLQLSFVKPDHTPIDSPLPTDSRARHARNLNWPTLPGGIIQLPKQMQVHWGGGWAIRRQELLNIGGHCRALAPFRNSDTRLGNRLVKHGTNSFLGTHPDLIADHLGATWYGEHRNDRDAIRQSRGPSHGATIANGGLAYWTSDTCRDSYRTLKVLDSEPVKAIL